jgi:acetoin:2,6-dichlorophenolindophenol oxidoreductase subunit alpha
VWAAVRGDIEEAIVFADNSPVPDIDQLLSDVYTVGTAQ